MAVSYAEAKDFLEITPGTIILLGTDGKVTVRWWKKGEHATYPNLDKALEYLGKHLPVDTINYARLTLN